MCSKSAASINRRCATCGAVVRQGAVYCPQCGTPMAVATSSATKPPRSKRGFPWITLLFVCCFFGVFHSHRDHSTNITAAPFAPSSRAPFVQSLPSDALAAIQPSEDARWDGGDVGLNIYNGSQWTICYLDLEIQVRQGFHSVRQVYRATINSTPLQPLSSEYVTVHTALPRMYQGSTMTYRIVGAMGTRPG